MTSLGIFSKKISGYVHVLDNKVDDAAVASLDVTALDGIVCNALFTEVSALLILAFIIEYTVIGLLNQSALVVHIDQIGYVCKGTFLVLQGVDRAAPFQVNAQGVAAAL